MTQNQDQKQYHSWVKIWLIIGLIMIIGQILIGAITRLTESGLSITEWNIVEGTLPPIGEAAWQAEFDLYKETPQYEKINVGMTLSEFKFIYFWEYFHRLWARLMGFVFIIPFFYFWMKGWLDKRLMKKLGITVFLAALVASLGWIMVASGLIERPWVNAYKLTMHLSIAFVLYGYLLWTIFGVIYPKKQGFPHQMLKSPLLLVTVLTIFQIILGGVMSGTRAGLNYPTWPDMNGQFIPSVLLDSSMWTVDNFVDYDTTYFLPALVQFIHRLVAYLLLISGLYFIWLALKNNISGLLKSAVYLLTAVLGMQVTLGILTVIFCVGSVPVGLGVAHQAGALFLLSVVLFINYHFSAYKKM